LEIPKEKTLEGTNIKKIITVMSGKGGVGKSSVTTLIAIALRKRGYKVGILDADITGPSIPKAFGINKERATGDSDKNMYPVETVTGIKVISLNLLVEQEDSPVVWRGPIIANTVKQFYTNVAWGELDYLLIDLPPGTGDVPITTMQSLPVDGIVVVSSPQDLVHLIVKKSLNMANMKNIPVYGIIENMSYLECKECKTKNYLFGHSNIDEIAREMGLEVLEKLAIDPEFAKLVDEGKAELYGDIAFGLMESIADKMVKKSGGDC
jgi:Mrp family chromosome partitioning ATPase